MRVRTATALLLGTVILAGLRAPDLYAQTRNRTAPEDRFARDTPGSSAVRGGGGGGGAIIPKECVKEPCPLSALATVGRNIFNLLIYVGGAVTVLAFVLAGIRYLVAVLQGASAAEIENAKRALGYAVVGTLVLLLSWVIVNTVLRALGGPGNLPGLL